MTSILLKKKSKNWVLFFSYISTTLDIKRHLYRLSIIPRDASFSTPLTVFISSRRSQGTKSGMRPTRSRTWCKWFSLDSRILQNNTKKINIYEQNEKFHIMIIAKPSKKYYLCTKQMEILANAANRVVQFSFYIYANWMASVRYDPQH
jgi:hypothetical protein